MVKRYLKAQLWVLLCGGLIGPVYLIVYYKFTSPDDRSLVGWVYWAGWAVTVADVLIALLLTSQRTRSAAKAAAMELDGVLALAQITGMAETGMSINEVDWERSALVNGLAAARFTVTEDNKTYDLTGQAGPLLEILQLLRDNNVPFNGPLDLRSADPALRQQVNDVVRRAAAAQPSPAFAAGPGAVADTPGFAPPRPSAAQRLQELAGLHANEAITDAEYEEKRRQIISET